MLLYIVLLLTNAISVLSTSKSWLTLPLLLCHFRCLTRPPLSESFLATLWRGYGDGSVSVEIMFSRLCSSFLTKIHNIRGPLRWPLFFGEWINISSYECDSALKQLRQDNWPHPCGATHKCLVATRDWRNVCLSCKILGCASPVSSGYQTMVISQFITPAAHPSSAWSTRALVDCYKSLLVLLF